MYNHTCIIVATTYYSALFGIMKIEGTEIIRTTTKEIYQEYTLAIRSRKLYNVAKRGVTICHIIEILQYMTCLMTMAYREQWLGQTSYTIRGASDYKA